MQPGAHRALRERIGGLTRTEVRVIDDVCNGRVAQIGIGALPDPGHEAATIRAEVLAYLMGGAEAANPVPSFGVQLCGVSVRGVVNLAGFDVPFGARLINCRFDSRIFAPALKIDRLNLKGCDLAGLYLERARINGYLLCEGGLRSREAITLTGAHIDGTLSLTGARITCAGQTALAATRCKVTDSVRLGGLVAEGRVTLLGARIGGQLSLAGARIRAHRGDAVNLQRVTVAESIFLNQNAALTGRVKLTGAQVEGQVIIRNCAIRSGGAETPGTLDLSGARIRDALTLEDAGIEEVVDCSDASVGLLNADRDTWQKAASYRLSGLTYDGFNLRHFTIGQIIGWLRAASRGASFEDDSGAVELIAAEDFNPQPYQQMARVLGEMGHRRDRKAVLIAMERGLKRWQCEELRAQKRGGLDGTWAGAAASFYFDARIALHLGFATLSRAIIGYGYRPAYSLLWAGAVIAVMAVASHEVYRCGAFAPTAAPILISEDWQALAGPPHETCDSNPAAEWAREDGPGRDYTTFGPVLYAADVFIPIVNLGQDAAWSPSTSRGWRGVWLHHAEPYVRLLGWVITAMGAAAISGAMRNE